VPAPLGALSAGDWLAGPEASGENTFAGFIDAPAAGAGLQPNTPLTVRGWVVDRSAAGWTGIDDVQIYLGLRDQGGALLSKAAIGQRREDVAAAFGNGYWTNAGYSATFTNSGLGPGPNLLTVYAHTPNRGWWYQQVEVRLTPLPAIGFADDPLVVIREVVPSTDVAQTVNTMTLRGYAIDRNMPPNLTLGVAGSGVTAIQVYLDGPPGAGVPLATADLGKKNREATGFGDRFGQSGFEIVVHPSDMSVDRHTLFIYATSAYWPNQSLVILPINVT
jgi:hypothetical protein